MWETLRAILYHNRRDVIMLLIVTILGIAIFLPMMTRWQVMGDYTTHNQRALDAVNDPVDVFLNTPHFLYQISVAILYRLMAHGDINSAAVWTLTLCYIAMMLVIFWQLRTRTILPPTLSIMTLLGALSVCLSAMMPINFFTPENLYFGYLVPHVYHNPTMIIMKPFALILFFMSLALFMNSKSLSRWWIIPFALFTGLSLLAKPSFIIAFVPTLGLLTLFLMIRRAADISAIISDPMSVIRAFTFKDHEARENLPTMLCPSYINWAVLIFGIVVPAFVVLKIQTITWTSSGGIEFNPFRVLFEWTLHYEENADKQIFYKFIMSTAFPLVVYIFHIGKSYKNLMLNIAWLMLFVSAAYMYLLVDKTVIAAGDFTWSIQIAILILYVASTIFMLKQYGNVLTGERLSARRWVILLICIVLFALHIVAGIHWYRMHMSQYMEELLYRWW